MERQAASGPATKQYAPDSGAKATRWYLTARPTDGGTRYAVYVDGRLVTAGHATGEEALIAAERILQAGGTTAPHEEPPA